MNLKFRGNKKKLGITNVREGIKILELGSSQFNGAFYIEFWRKIID